MASRGGRYQRLRAIASGGMATVYLGRALGAGGFERMVAIKVMHPHIATNPEFVSMFLDEARVAARIRHPNVVSTLDVDADENGVFLVMEFIEGPSLHFINKTFRKSKGKLPMSISLAIVTDVLAGLHAAHQLESADGALLHLVHRDVSPQNILVGVDGIVRITDFGIARAESRLAQATHSGQLKGKLGYMSIEQLRSQPVDRRSDVYSAGVVLWELLAGERLFKGENDAAIALAAAAGPVQSPSDVNAEVPAELDEVVMRALSRTVDDRWPTAAAFADAIEEATAKAGVTIGRARDIRGLLQRMDEDGPTQIKSEKSAKAAVAAIIKARGEATPTSTSTPISTPRNMPTRPDGIIDDEPSTATRELPTVPLDADGDLPTIAAVPMPDFATADASGPHSERSVTSPTAGGAVLPADEPAPPVRRRAVRFAAIGAAAILACALIYRGMPDDAAAPPSVAVQAAEAQPPPAPAPEPKPEPALVPAAATAAADAPAPAPSTAPKAAETSRPKTPRTPRSPAPPPAGKPSPPPASFQPKLL